MKNNSFLTSIKYTFYVIVWLSVIFIVTTIVWIWITPYKFTQFYLVLCKIFKSSGSYSVLLVGIVITTFFQVYLKEKELQNEDRIKIGEVGYYTLAFKRQEDEYEEDYNGDKLVVEINDKSDYDFNDRTDKSVYFHFMTKFLTSKSESTNLKNIMAFSEDYFEKNKNDILKNYYHFCERITYCSPLYCSAKPTGELINNNEIDRSRYFWLLLNCEHTDFIKKFWISAVTQDGVLLFIKVKAKIQIIKENNELKARISLLQQTTYYERHNQLCVLYR